MIDVDTRRLIRRLNPSCTRALERAAGIAISRTHFEVACEHLLLALLDDRDGDIRTMLRRMETDPGRLEAALHGTLERFRAQNPGQVVWSFTLLEWLRDGWLMGSLEYGLDEIRSGVLMAAFLATPERYATQREVGALDALGAADVRARLLELTAGSSEDRPAADAPGSVVAHDASGRSADSALARFTIDFTAKARAGEIDPVFCRDRAIRQMVDILARRRKNNPILVGEAGVGKTAVVEGLALQISTGDVPEFLRGVDLLTLDLGLLQAGAGVRGEFEARLKGVITEVKTSVKPVVLFIDEAHTIIGAGAAAGGGDAANLLKPALARGELRTIAATTWSEYKKYFEKDPALARRFQLVSLEEPSEADAVSILRGLRKHYSRAHGVDITDEAVVAAARLSARFISGRQLPDKAVDLLDTAAARVKIGLTGRPQAIESLARRIEILHQELDSLQHERPEGSDPSAREGELIETLAVEREALLSAEERWNAESAAVVRVRRLLEEQRQTPNPGAAEELTSARETLRSLQGGHPLIDMEVSGESVARVVADWTGVPVGEMLRTELQKIDSLETRLSGRIRGQDEALRIIVERIRHAKFDLIENANAPLGVFLLAGPSGVGKTETARAVADLLFGGDRFMVTINMSEFQEKHTVSRLIGSPPGYVGYGEGGVLTEAVRQRPYCVVLLDEIEKADPEVLNLFYQVFDKGTLADGEGRIVDFKQAVIFLTTNLGGEDVIRLGSRVATPDLDAMTQAVQPAIRRHFKPALLHRMTVVPYRALGDEVLRDIARARLDALASRLAARQRMTLTIDDTLVDHIVSRCTETESGVRHIDHIVERTLLPQLASLLFSGITDGGVHGAVTARVAEGGGVQLVVTDALPTSALAGAGA